MLQYQDFPCSKCGKLSLYITNEGSIICHNKKCGNYQKKFNETDNKKSILCGKLIKDNKINIEPYKKIKDANYYIMAENNCKHTYQSFYKSFDNLPVFVCSNCERQVLTPIKWP